MRTDAAPRRAPASGQQGLRRRGEMRRHAPNPVQKDSNILYGQPPALTLHARQIKGFPRQALTG